MARAKFKLTGLRAYVEQCGAVSAEKAAKRIVDDLKEAGPYYTGHFEEQWVVLPGDKRVPANVDNPISQTEMRNGARDGVFPLNRRRTEVPIPKLDPKGDPAYTIGNRASYRNIAMDLEPGRYDDSRQNTAPQDWYVTYIQAGGLKKALGQGAKDAANDPRVKGFKRTK